MGPKLLSTSLLPEKSTHTHEHLLPAWLKQHDYWTEDSR